MHTASVYAVLQLTPWLNHVYLYPVVAREMR
jgi:hypothetical protein